MKLQIEWDNAQNKTAINVFAVSEKKGRVVIGKIDKGQTPDQAFSNYYTYLQSYVTTLAINYFEERNKPKVGLASATGLIFATKYDKGKGYEEIYRQTIQHLKEQKNKNWPGSTGPMADHKAA